MELDEWLCEQLARVRRKLDAHEENVERTRRVHRNALVQDEYRWHGRMQWYVQSFGTGHGQCEGTRPIDSAPGAQIVSDRPIS